ncbi:MAG: hypothetical protein WD872_18795 [Pirellulaceae bacterium]
MKRADMKDKAALAFFVWLCLLPAALAQEPQPLDQLLARLGLADLRLHHLERSLESAGGEQQAAIARNLADAYAEQLLAAADDPPRFEELKTRVDRLLAAHAAAQTPSLQVILLQADYQRAEALMIGWLDNPADAAPLAAARELLGRIAPVLATQQKELAAQAETLLDKLESLKTERQRVEAEQRAGRLQASASRAAYFAGWSNYYLGVAQQDPPAAAPQFALAKEMFLGLLDVVDDKEYELVEAESLALESLWRARAAIGLGLTELALDRTPAAANIFSWLDHPSAATEIRDQAGYWHVQGLLNVKQYALAAEQAEASIATFSGAPSAGKNSLCISLIRAAAALPSEQTELRRKLVEPGIRGLARLRQFDTLASLFTKYNLDGVADPGSFYLAWLRGRQQFLAAEKSKSPDEYRAAANTLQKALALPQAKTELTDAAQCRYYWAWCQYRLGEFEVAAAAFLEAVTALKTGLPELAVQSAWMQCVCRQQLAAKDKRQIGPAMTAMQRLIADFPGTEQASKAEFALTQLRQASATPQEAIASLSAIGPGDANYLAAQYELCQLRHAQWSKVKTDAARAQPLATELLRSVDRFLAAAAKSSDRERKLRASLLAIDVLLEPAQPETTRVAAYLRGAAAAAAAVDPASLPAAEFHYRRLQIAQKTKDEGEAQDAADWIVAHASGSPYELPALVVAARAADRAAQQATAAERQEKVAAAAAIYTRLVELLGDSPEKLAGTKNALAASSRLALYDEALGNWQQAAIRLGRLVAAVPSDKGYLRRAGVAYFQVADFPASLECWRKLLGGVPPGSDDWLEAKYYQLACLLQTDRPAADQVWKQFQLLYPDVKSATWRDKFVALGKEFTR